MDWEEYLHDTSNFSFGQVCSLALQQDQYDVAASLYLARANRLLNLIPSDKPLSLLNDVEKSHVENFFRFRQLAVAYLAYLPIYEYVTFRGEQTRHSVLQLFQRALYLYNELEFLKQTSPVDKTKVLAPQLDASIIFWALAQLSAAVGAYQLCKSVFSRLLRSNFPKSWTRKVKEQALAAKSFPTRDAASLLPVCYYCRVKNPLYNSKGNRCVQCQEPFTFCMACFDVLPLVRVPLPNSINDSEADALINLDPPITSDPSVASHVSSLKLSHSTFGEPTRIETLLLNERTLANLTKQILLNTPKHLIFQQNFQRQSISIVRYKLVELNQDGNDYEQDFNVATRIAHCKHCMFMFHADEYRYLAKETAACFFCRAQALA